MTGTELVSAIQGHLGDRSSGYIGGELVATSVMNSLNKALDKVCKGFNPRELKKAATISVTTAAYQYAFPTTDIGSNTIRFKNCDVARLVASGGTTGRPLAVLTNNIKDSIWSYIDSNQSGRPAVISFVGETVELYPYPDGTYTVYLWVNTWPTLFTAATLGNNSPLNSEWDAVVEAYATHDCFAKLQQVQDASAWYNIFNRENKNTVAQIRKVPDLTMDAGLRDLPSYRSADYARDPFYSRSTI